jgi:hypothetical protein
MRAKISIFACALLVACAAMAQAQTKSAIETHPGYVNFQSLGITGGDQPKVEVNLKGSLLNLASRIVAEEEPELSTTIASLEAIRVEVYDLEDRAAGGYIQEINETAERLEREGWETIVRVRDDEEQVFIAIKPDGDNIVGLVVLAAEEDDEMALVNIVGNIDLTEIWRVGREFDIDHLDSVRHHERKSKG